MGRLLLLFILVPAIELALLIEIGSRIGTLATLALIAATGVAGASLARRQGLQVLREVQRQLARGELPAGSLVDGVLILLAGALLMTPGILTDAVGFLCLIPSFRSAAKGWLLRRLERAVREQRVLMSVHVEGSGFGAPPHSDDVLSGRGAPGPRRGPVIDIEPGRPARDPGGRAGS